MTDNFVTAGPNKFDLLNRITISDQRAEDKVLLIELVLRLNTQTGQLNPSVERLAKARGIKHAKNFKGADAYLPGLVTKTKQGRKNHYSLNLPAIMELSEGEVNISHYTPAVEGVSNTTNSTNAPAVADDTPAVEGLYNPAVEGVYSPALEGSNTSRDSSVDSSSNKGGVTHVQKEDQGSPLVNTKSPLVREVLTSGESDKGLVEIDISSGDVVDAVASPTPGRPNKTSGSFIVKRDKSPGTSHVPAQNETLDHRARLAKQASARRAEELAKEELRKARQEEFRALLRGEDFSPVATSQTAAQDVTDTSRAVTRMDVYRQRRAQLV